MQKYILIVILVLTLLAFIYFFFFKSPNTTSSIKVKLGDTEYNLEVAKTMAQKAQGLSNRTSLCKNCGMIFVFSQDGTQPFWMKDTLIPLDMIWINSSGQIVSIQTANPQPNTPLTKLKIYQNSNPAKYVIELNANDSQKLNLKTGDIINIPNL